MTMLRVNGAPEEVAARTIAELLEARGIDPKARFSRGRGQWNRRAPFGLAIIDPCTG